MCNLINIHTYIHTPYRKQPRSTRIVVAYPRPAFSATKRTNHAPNSFDQQAQVSQGYLSITRHAEMRKIVISSKPAREPASSRPKPCASKKNAPTNRILPVCRSLLALVRKKQTVVRDELSPQKLPGSRLWFSRTRVQHSPGSSTIELPSVLAISGDYSPDSACHGTLPRAAASYPASRVPLPPEGHEIGARKRRAPGNTILTQPLPPPRPNRPAESRKRPAGCIS